MIPRNDRLPLHAGFLASLERVPENAALEVDGSTLTYRELRERASRIAAALAAHATGDPVPLTAVFAYRSRRPRSPACWARCCAGTVTCRSTAPSRSSGHAADARARGCRASSCGRRASSQQLADVLAGAAPGFVIVVPDGPAV